MKKYFTLLLSILTVCQLYGAILTVSNTNDSGPGSLREAATLATNGDTITFSNSLLGSGNAIISLNSSITINDIGLTILGLQSSTDSIVIANSEIVFYNNSPLPANIYIDDLIFEAVSIRIYESRMVKINNCTMKNSINSAINFISSYSDSELEINNSEFTNCNSSDFDLYHDGNGGAVNAGCKNLNVLNSNFSNDSTSFLTDNCFGGAICHSTREGFNYISTSPGNINLINCHFYNNKSSDKGGAIFSEGILNMQNCIVNFNSSLNEGGGIYGDTLSTIENSTLENNTSLYGGGIFGNKNLNITNSSMIGNQSQTGGGINCKSIFRADSCVFENNAATSGGGGIICQTLHLCNSTLKSNNANLGGGAVIVLADQDTTHEIYNCKFDSNIVSGSTTDSIPGFHSGGAALYILATPTTVLNPNQDSLVFNISNTTISNNIALDSVLAGTGAGILIQNRRPIVDSIANVFLNIDSTWFDGNISNTNEGACIYVDSLVNLRIDQTSFKNNNSVIHTGFYSNLLLSRSLFAFNGGIYSYMNGTKIYPKSLISIDSTYKINSNEVPLNQIAASTFTQNDSINCLFRFHGGNTSFYHNTVIGNHPADTSACPFFNIRTNSFSHGSNIFQENAESICYNDGPDNVLCDFEKDALYSPTGTCDSIALNFGLDTSIYTPISCNRWIWYTDLSELMLTPLQYNGGLHETMMPLPGSPLIDAYGNIPHYSYSYSEPSFQHIEKNLCNFSGFYYWSANLDSSFNNYRDIGAAEYFCTIDSSEQFFTECQGYSVTVGTNTYNTTGNYRDTLVNIGGCDSIVKTNLTILSNSNFKDTRTECGSYTWIDGNTYTASNNSATYNIVGGAANGCDSLVTLDLTINNVSDITTTTFGGTISANNSGATYQWLDCDNGNAILGLEIGQSYTATVNGNYAVELTEHGCIDTSACVTLTTVGIIENSFGNDLAIYPNPTSGNFSIDLGAVYQNSQITITDMAGKLIESKTISTSQFINLSIEEHNGIYIVSVQAGDKKAAIRLVKE